MKNQNYLLLLAVMIVAAALGTLFIPSTTGLAAPAHASPARSNDKALTVCHVIIMDGTDATVVSTGKSVFLKQGTALTLVDGRQHQGYIAVKTKVGGRLTTVSIMVEDTDCL